jgi:MFS family permease
VRERLLGYIALGLCKLLPEAAVMLAVDKAGRRPLLITSSLGVTLFIFALSASFATGGSGRLTIALLCAYMVTNPPPPRDNSKRVKPPPCSRFLSSWGIPPLVLLPSAQVCFSVGMGPVTWLIAAEMLPSRARAKGMTLCCFVNRLVSGGVALSALSTCDALGFTGFFALCEWPPMGALCRWEGNARATAGSSHCQLLTRPFSVRLSLLLVQTASWASWELFGTSCSCQKPRERLSKR